ncbi:MAG: HPr kinase/phosphorylase [Candidatus Anoxychlamydiales bacterium]|uniref:HPr kinase/phosphorylase C-terminal domain-containing protein n=1 Tax=marine sediment metagenome TaxID=412755 RepID=A0A0F9GPU6_9ZZZZ|nr:HPr kinase/phosphorylase [Candidatus Anoxychlamydiales bacterium]
MIYRVKDFYKKYKNSLKIELFAGETGLKKRIKKPEVHRPGLSLTGYIKNYKSYRILVIGKGEIQYLKDLDPEKRLVRLREILTKETPAVIVSRKITPLKELKIVCEENSIALFRSDVETMALISKIIIALSYEFSPTITMHGTLVEVFGMGVLIQGESSVGKSEAALGLLEKGHRLISDDVVKIRKKDENALVGSGPELTRHLIEVRGIGIINVSHLYGALCVRPDIVLDIVIKLEAFDPSHFYDRTGLKDNYVDILGVNIPFHLVPVNPGRDVVLLIETLTLNQRLKSSGFNSAKEFNVKLLEKLAKRKISTSEIN